VVGGEVVGGAMVGGDAGGFVVVGGAGTVVGEVASVAADTSPTGCGGVEDTVGPPGGTGAG
jgi:hypothetical protein